ncbi:MAG: ABC transporter permease [Termitinemataceae bacterium]|nr:MAG: ABC transporter permease [Termitinemataceae bacterium]
MKEKIKAKTKGKINHSHASWHSLFIAARYLIGKGNKGSRYLLGAAGGIALSMIPIMVTLIVSDGMIRGITDRFLELGTGHLQVWPYRVTQNQDLEAQMQDAKETILAIDNIRQVWEEKQGLGIIIAADGKTGTTIRAVDPSFWEDTGSVKYLSVIKGEALLKNDTDVLLGEELAKSIGAEVGKPLRIMTVRNTSLGKSIPMVTAFTVRGIVSSGYHEMDSMWCFVSLNAGEKIFQVNNCYTYLVIKINDPYKYANYAANDIDANLDGAFGVYTWKDLQRSQYSSYESTRQLLLLIMALIVLVASVNVSSATSMLVIERRRDIAVLKSFGASVKDIKNIFMWGSFLTGIAGAVPGIAAGLLIGCNINQIIHGVEHGINLFTALLDKQEVRILDPGFYLEQIPIVIDVKTVVSIGVFTLLCSVAASLFPAMRAARTKPIELIRKY